MTLGALEAGGTKMVCAVGDETGRIYEETFIPTETPELTFPKLIDFFRDKQIASLGIACFGPIDLNEQSDTYGYITTTPKQGWAHCDIVGTFQKALGCPVGFDTDVNGSVLGEVTFGQAKGKKNVIYLTIGTGIGAGIYTEGTLLHGMMHPEAGHLLLRKRQDDAYEGNCPYHKNCFEGMAAGPAIEKRWGEKPVLLQGIAEVWDLEAWYIAQALTDYILVLSPELIILGGGVMHQEQLFPLIRRYVREMLGGYIRTPQMNDLEHYIVSASLDDRQGILGCLELARRAAKQVFQKNS
jgi:fructokinase